MGKEKGFALSSIRAKDMGRSLERHGYSIEPGQHQHLKLRHDRLGTVLLSLRRGDNLRFAAVKQIAATMRMTPEE